MADHSSCAAQCHRCAAGDPGACRKVQTEPRCAASCPPWLQFMGGALDDSLQPVLDDFAADRGYWDPLEDEGGETPHQDRDVRMVSYAGTKGAGRDSMVPAQYAHHGDVWGGGLRRMTTGGVGPRREDEHYHAPRYVPIGFARYVSPTVDPGDYRYFHLSGWRVAVPRTFPAPAVRTLLLRIYQYGPASAGYARLGDTLVPAILGPGDRQTLADTEPLDGPASSKYPLQ